MDSKRTTRFIIGFSVLALCINSQRFHGLEQERQAQIAQAQRAAQAQQQAQVAAQQAQQAAQEAQQRQQQQAQEEKQEQQRQAQAEQAAQAAAERHAQFIARYLNGGADRQPGTESLAVMVATDDGTENRPACTALANRFKSKTVQTFPAYFKPAFVSDGLFGKLFDGSNDVFGKLDLVGSLDAVLLGRESVQYSTNPSLDNVLTATMQLELVLIPVSGSGGNQTWTFTAHGAGFKQPDAKAMAEERLIKQINEATNLMVASPNQ